MRKTTKKDCSLETLRKQALEDTALSVKSIRRQKLYETDNNETVRCALKNSEEAMAMLALNLGGDDEEMTHRILSEHGLEELL